MRLGFELGISLDPKQGIDEGLPEGVEQIHGDEAGGHVQEGVGPNIAEKDGSFQTHLFEGAGQGPAVEAGNLHEGVGPYQQIKLEVPLCQHQQAGQPGEAGHLFGAELQGKDEATDYPNGISLSCGVELCPAIEE